MNNSKKTFTVHQIGALLTMIIIAVWGIWAFWFNINQGIGLEHMEILFMSAILPICVILVLFYVVRIRWSYISGTIVLLGLYAGLLKTLVDRTYFFSLTAYNLTTVAVFICAAASIYFSMRSYFEILPVGWLNSVIGIGSLLAVSAVAIWLVSDNRMLIENYVLKHVIRGVQKRTVNIDNLDVRIEALMDEGDIPSLATAIVVNDNIVWMRSFGEQDTLDKMHDIGSTTKSFIATAVLQLYERGLIDLNDDINQYLSFNVRHPNYPDVPITFHMLLSNRSCLAHNNNLYMTYMMGPTLRQWSIKTMGWESRPEFESLSYPDFLTSYLNPEGSYYQTATWANCRPGTQFVYSTPGFDLLGYLVEQVSGQTLSDYLQENIFTPLHMTTTTATPLENAKQVAIPYERFNGVLSKTNIQLPFSQRWRIGGGSLYSTVGDLANFLTAHMNQGEFEGYQLLRPETLALMHKKRETSGGDFLQTGYGYGWGRYRKEPYQMWDITFESRGYQGHGGTYWGYSCAMFMVEEEHGTYGYALLINTGHVGKEDWPWDFAIKLNLGNLILQEAHRLYIDSLSQ